MRTLNRQRANLVASNVFEQVYEKVHAAKEKPTANTDLLSIRIPTPQEVSSQERVFEEDGVLRWKGKKCIAYCKIGVDLRTILNLFEKPSKATGSYSGAQSVEFAKLLDLYRDDEYIMWNDHPRNTFLIVLKDGAQTTTHLRAWMHALYHAEASKLGRLQEEETLIEALASTKTYVTKVLDRFEVFEELQKAGWDIETGAMETRSGTRIKMKSI